MEFAKRFALVPEETLTKHSISKKQLSELDQAMIQILNSSLEEHEKVIRYYELLQKRLKLKQFNPTHKLAQVESTQPLSEGEKPLSEDPQERKLHDSYDDFILNSVAPNLKRRAQSALSVLKSRPNILSWNDKGEIIYHGEKIQQSNIADLFNLIFTDKKKTFIPAKDSFLNALEELNLPKQFIRNKYLKVSSPDVKKKKVKHENVVERKWENF